MPKKPDKLEIELTPTESIAIRSTMALRDAALTELQTAQTKFRTLEDDLSGVGQRAVEAAGKPFDGHTWRINDNSATMLIGSIDDIKG